VDITRTDQHADTPSHPTPRARDLRERLDRAADEGLSANAARFLRFLGHEEGDVIKLQALGVQGKYAPTNTLRTRGRLRTRSPRSSTPTGIYVLFNAVDPDVVTRAERLVEPGCPHRSSSRTCNQPQQTTLLPPIVPAL
jgi:hypothetical protein